MTKQNKNSKRRSRNGNADLSYQPLNPRIMLAVTADFNGDGFEDMAVGAPGANQVSVIFGSNTGLLPQGKVGVPARQSLNGAALNRVANGAFGQTLAAGDFDNDGFGDLAIGEPNFNNGLVGVSNTGGVHVLYGSRSGLSVGSSQFWNQNSPGIEGVSEGNEQFGFALAVGDFDGDTFDDLAVGAPGEQIIPGNIGALALGNRGAVNVIYGGSGGLTSAGNKFFSQSTSGIPGDPDIGDNFGWSLASADFNKDGRDDLAIGIPGERVSLRDAAGEVLVLFGSSGPGLTTTGNQVWNLSSSRLDGNPSINDYFGSSLAAGDFNNDNSADLAIGITGRKISGENKAGEVRILLGSSSGLKKAGHQILSQDSPGVEGAAERDDEFGTTMTANDFNADGRDDLVVGVPKEDIGLLASAGAVHVFFGNSVGVDAVNDRLFFQNQAPLADTAEASDAVGAAVGSGDFNGDGRADLVIGAPGENGHGIVQVINGAATGFATTSSTYSPNAVAGTNTSGFQFGSGLNGASDQFSGFNGSGLSAVQTSRRPGASTPFDLRVRLKITNPGTTPTQRFKVRFFISDDPVFDRRDRFVGQVRLNAMAAKQSVEINQLFRQGQRKSMVGKYLIAILDYGDRTGERNEANNILVIRIQ